MLGGHTQQERFAYITIGIHCYSYKFRHAKCYRMCPFANIWLSLGLPRLMIVYVWSYALHVSQLLSSAMQVHVPAGSLSPDFDPAFASEAECMFSLGQEPGSIGSSADQLQRRLRLSDVGLQQSLITEATHQDALLLIKASWLLFD